MFRSIEDFLVSWTQEVESTGKVLGALTDASLSRSVTPGGRTLGKLAWHLVETLQEMLPAAGLQVEFVIDPHSVPDQAAEISRQYRAGAVAVAQALEAQWDDATLQDTVMMYGMPWKRGFTLHVLLMHQAHHRGQMTVLMRQAGLAVPGVCGPSREEWIAFGMEPQD
ncbi:MAG: hypothetical protein RL318_2335 [Fibrobacterota bacterium]|jgi:uncharacterized damage-inducible protein DinB